MSSIRLAAISSFATWVPVVSGLQAPCHSNLLTQPMDFLLLLCVGLPRWGAGSPQDGTFPVGISRNAGSCLRGGWELTC